MGALSATALREAWGILCFHYQSSGFWSSPNLFKIVADGRTGKERNSLYNLRCWKLLRKPEWRMVLGAKYKNFLQRTCLCWQLDPPVAEQLLVFSWHSTWAAYPLILPKENVSFQKPFLAWCIKSKLISSGHRVSSGGWEPAGGLSSAHTMSAEKWNDIFLLLLFIPGVSVCNSPRHPGTTLLIKAIFCKVVYFTWPTFITIDYPLGESSQCSSVVTANNPGSGWNKQESRMWTWWCDKTPH